MKIMLLCLLLITTFSFAETDMRNQYSDWGLSRYGKSPDKAWEFWSLTEVEWARYQYLLKNSPWSTWEHNASPLQILSFYTSSKSEKRRYARIEAELDQWRQDAVSEFQTLYDRERKIVHSQYVEFISSKNNTLENISLHDKLKLFISASSCDASCRALMKRLNDTQANLDIFLLDASGKPDDVVFEWAKSANVSVERVKVKQITLNRDNGMFSIVSKEAGSAAPKLPGLFKQEADGKLVRIPL
jgi:integrating conjugative element protein (TIGR03759 family)